jgi:hypothetical protein
MGRKHVVRFSDCGDGQGLKPFGLEFPADGIAEAKP